MKTMYVILVSWAVTAAAGQNCHDGPLTMGGMKIPKADIVNQAIGFFFDGAGKAIADNKTFKDFMQSRGQCQVNGCIDKMVPEAVSTVYGKCGDKFMGDKCGGLIVESLTGAFMACFPGAPRDQVHTTVGNIIANFGKEPPNDHSAMFAKNKECPNKATDFPKDDFIQTFGDALKTVAETHPQKMAFLANGLDCQMKCLNTNVLLASATLFQTGNQDKKQIIQAITGASRACFPGQKREDIKTLMTAIVEVIAKTQAGAPEQLYNANVQVEATSWTSLPMLGGAAVLSMVIFLTGIAVGKRMSSLPTGNSDVEDLE